MGGQHSRKRTVESFGLGKEPIKPTSLEIQLPKLFKGTLLVHFWVVGKLSTFDEAEDNCVFEPSQDRTNPVEGERVSGGRVIGLHDWLPGGDGERTVGGISRLTWYLYLHYFAVPFPYSLRSADRSRAIQILLKLAGLRNEPTSASNWSSFRQTEFWNRKQPLKSYYMGTMGTTGDQKEMRGLDRRDQKGRTV